MQVELEAVYEAPENPCQGRHVYGVGEKVKFKVEPALAEVSITTSKFDVNDGGCAYELFDGCETSVGGGQYPNWEPGRLEWKIPIGWFRIGTDEREFGFAEVAERVRSEGDNSRPLLVGGRSDSYKEVFTIDEDGTAKVEKFGHWLSCGRYCRIYLDGVMKKWNHWLWEEH